MVKEKGRRRKLNSERLEAEQENAKVSRNEIGEKKRSAGYPARLKQRPGW